MFITSKDKEEHLAKVYKVLFETAAESLVVADEKGNIVLVNTRTNEMFGYGEGELLGQPLEVLLPEKLRKGHIKHREDFNVSPKRRSMGMGMELLGRRKDDSQFPVEVSLNYFQLEGQNFAIGLVTDISGRYYAEEKLKKMYEELEKLVHDRTEELEESKRLYQTVARNFPRWNGEYIRQEFKICFCRRFRIV